MNKQVTTQLLPLPLDLERSFGMYAARIVGHVQDRSMRVLDSRLADISIRYDAEEDIPSEVLAAFAALGISYDTLINDTNLRESLRRIAHNLDARTKQLLNAATGVKVDLPLDDEIEQWVEIQAVTIRGLVEDYIAKAEAVLAKTSATNVAGTAAAVAALGGESTTLQKAAFALAGAAVLALNEQLTSSVAKASGADQYVWRTQQDSKVRGHHAALDGTFQSFENPPTGGGSGPDYPGNPGSGKHCRCQAELVILR